MNSTYQTWTTRTAILLGVSIIVVLGFYLLNFTDWADGFRVFGQGRSDGLGPGGGNGMGRGGGHGHDLENLGIYLHYIEPVIKAFVMIGVPMLVGWLIGLTYKKVSKKAANR